MVSETASAPRGSSAIPAAATTAAGARCPSRRRVAPAGSDASRRSSSWRPSALLLPPVPPKQIARSTITATERMDSAMSTQRTQSEPSSVKPRIRWVRCMRSPRLPWKTLSQSLHLGAQDRVDEDGGVTACGEREPEADGAVRGGRELEDRIARLEQHRAARARQLATRAREVLAGGTHRGDRFVIDGAGGRVGG